jgi:hypothetical protein
VDLGGVSLAHVVRAVGAGVRDLAGFRLTS